MVIFMKRFLILLMACALLFSAAACGTGSSDPVDADTPTAAPSIDGAREIILNKLSSYYSENKEKLAVLADALLQSEYKSVHFYANTADVWKKGANTTKNIAKDDLDKGLMTYYSLIDPFFTDIVRCDAGQWAASVDTVSFDYDIIQTSYPDLAIEGILCYGKGVAKSLDASSLDYIDVLDDNWVVFYNYIANDVRTR